MLRIGLVTFLGLLLQVPGCMNEVIELKPTAKIDLVADEVTCTFAALHVRISVTQAPWRLSIKRDGQSFFYVLPVYTNLALDTVIVDKWLMPNSTNHYTAYYLLDSVAFDSSGVLTVSTMDTTSHNFTWRLYTLGDGLGYGLRDVAIVNDTCVYAVGDLFLNDSTGRLETVPYGLAKWNGFEWKPMRIYSNDSTRLVHALSPTGVIAFSDTDAWFAAGGVFHFNGTTIDHSYWINGYPGNPDPVLDSLTYAERVWGTSSSDLYVGATNGGLAHFDGMSWRKIESGTHLYFEDIWGSKNPRTGQMEVLAVASDYLTSTVREVVSLSPTTAEAVTDSGINNSLTGIWFVSGRMYWATGGDVFTRQDYLLPDAWFRASVPFTWNYKFAVRGNDINDVIVVGTLGEVMHYNGYSWKNLSQGTALTAGQYFRVAIRGDLVVAVGVNHQLGVVAIGRR